ncbi:MAG: HAD family hydrolase [Nanoarchaeota archaeon]|nr:HAD family hydrolase [Nanoarchaeota archaeon]MBU1623264.1 HAD family hydrolase [Nanoarchaeota archaeon]
MTKAILLDFWGTLVENGVRSPIKQVQTILQINLPFSEYVVRMERAMMTEKFATLKDAFNAVCREFNLDPGDDIVDELVGMWNKNWMLAKPYLEVNQVLAELKEKYTLILISNTDNFSVENVLEKFNLSPYFDKIFFSYQTHLIKTDKNFLKVVLDDLRLNPDECILVGDSLQSDILAAKKIGMPAVLLDRRHTREFNPKINNLAQLKETLK